MWPLTPKLDGFECWVRANILSLTACDRHQINIILSRKFVLDSRENGYYITRIPIAVLSWLVGIHASASAAGTFLFRRLHKLHLFSYNIRASPRYTVFLAAVCSWLLILIDCIALTIYATVYGIKKAKATLLWASTIYEQLTSQKKWSGTTMAGATLL